MRALPDVQLLRNSKKLVSVSPRSPSKLNPGMNIWLTVSSCAVGEADTSTSTNGCTLDQLLYVVPCM